jgi:hypothetical protein
MQLSIFFMRITIGAVESIPSHFLCVIYKSWLKADMSFLKQTRIKADENFSKQENIRLRLVANQHEWL